MAGGGDAARGLNLLVRGPGGGPGVEAEGEICNVGGKNTFSVAVGDRLQVHTPGGGGYGESAAAGAPTGSSSNSSSSSDSSGNVPVRTSGSVHQWQADQESG